MKFFILLYSLISLVGSVIRNVKENAKILNRLENLERTNNEIMTKMENFADDHSAKEINEIKDKKLKSKLKERDFISNQSIQFHTIYNKTNSIKKIPNVKVNVSSKYNRSKFAKNRNKSLKSSREENIFTGDYTSTERTLKFYIDHSLECSVFINDTVLYRQFSQINYLEHMLLHNNVDSVEQKGVYSNQIEINSFTFNKKLNTFGIYFDSKNEVDLYSIEYDYNAINLIKSYSAKDAFADDTTKNYNMFIWKIINQNFIEYKEKINFEIYFSLGDSFQPNRVEFPSKMRNITITKEFDDIERKTFYVFRWSGILEPQEVFVLGVKFPLYFESCGNIQTNFVMIVIGSIFIMLLIGMLYIILATVFCEEI